MNEERVGKILSI